MRSLEVMESVESGCGYTGLLQRQWTIRQADNGEGVTWQAPSKVALSSYRSAVHRVAEEIRVAPILGAINRPPDL